MGFPPQRPVGRTAKVTSMLRSFIGLIGDIALARAQVRGVYIGLYMEMVEMFLVWQEAVVVQHPPPPPLLLLLLLRQR